MNEIRGPTGGCKSGFLLKGLGEPIRFDYDLFQSANIVLIVLKIQATFRFAGAPVLVNEIMARKNDSFRLRQAAAIETSLNCQPFCNAILLALGL